MTTLSPPIPAPAVPAGTTATTLMHALVYHGPDSKAWEEVPKPVLIDDTDAIVRVDATTICGTDLHILKGDVPEVTDGRILGHEAVGTVESVGSLVKNVKVGEQVRASCLTACGARRYCRDGSYWQCLGGAGEWILGHKIDGTAGSTGQCTVPAMMAGLKPVATDRWRPQHASQDVSVARPARPD